MFSKNQIDKLIFFDIETVLGKRNLETLRDEDPKVAHAFDAYCIIRNEENIDCETFYRKIAMTTPEYLKIICFSYGVILFNEDGTFDKIQRSSFYGDDEKIVLEDIAKLLTKAGKSGYSLAGWNSKNFDIPVLTKRFLINGIRVPDMLWTVNKKPWEVNHIDLKEIWKFGGWENKSSLEEVAIVLGVASSKDEMHGDLVGKAYYEDNNLEGIKNYCEEDVRATAEIMLKMSDIKYQNF